MNKDKLKSIINKKANGDNDMSMQLYQMFFFEHILEKLSKSNYKENIILKGRFTVSLYYWRKFKNDKGYGCKFKKYSTRKRTNTKNISRNIRYRYPR